MEFWANPWVSLKNETYQNEIKDANNTTELASKHPPSTPRQFMGYRYQYDFPFAGNPAYIYGQFANTPSLEAAPKGLQLANPRPKSVQQWWECLLKDLQEGFKSNPEQVQSLQSYLKYFELALPIARIKYYEQYFNNQSPKKNVSQQELKQLYFALKRECQTIKTDIKHLTALNVVDHKNLNDMRKTLMHDNDDFDDDKRGILCLAKATFDRGLQLQKQCATALQKVQTKQARTQWASLMRAHGHFQTEPQHEQTNEQQLTQQYRPKR